MTKKNNNKKNAKDHEHSTVKASFLGKLFRLEAIFGDINRDRNSGLTAIAISDGCLVVIVSLYALKRGSPFREVAGLAILFLIITLSLITVTSLATRFVARK